MKRLKTVGTTRGVGWTTAGIALTAMLLMVLFVLPGCSKKSAAEEERGEDVVRATPVQVTTAVRTDMQTDLKVTGTTKTTDKADVVAEISGKVDRVYVDVGDYVKAGTTLVSVDTDIAAAQRGQASVGVRNAKAALEQAQEVLQLTTETTASGVRQAEVNVQSAKDRLKQAKASAQLVESQVNSAIEQARNGVRSAETRLAEVRTGARQQERRQAEADLQRAQAALDLAKQTWERHKRLLDGGAISQQQFDQVATEYRIAQQNYQKAVEQCSLINEGARTEEVRLAELAVDQAKEQLAQAQANSTQIEVAQQEVRAAESAVRQAEEQLTAAIANRGQVDVQQRQVESARTSVEQAQAGEHVASVRLRKYTVVAPISGTVSARMVNPGEGVSPGLPLISIVSNEMLYLEGRVSEPDLPELRVGLPAEVRLDALPDEVFEGEIIALSPAVNEDSRTGIARVRIVNPNSVARTGMFARASIITANHEDAVVVDRDALLSEGDDTYVFVLDGTVARRQPIEIGLQSESRVEVISGVEAGDQVVIEGQSQLKDGAKVRIVDEPTTREGDAQ